LVINCGDAGQEGELQRWDERSQYKGEVQRLWISSLTTEAIKEVSRTSNHLPTMIIYTMQDFPEPLVTGYWE
jgi:DNA topoisomerase IA